MPGALTHSPADVLRRLLISLGLGVDPPPTSTTQWPVYAGSEPDEPDNTVTVTDTSGLLHGREMVGGETQAHEGVQVRVRGLTHPVAYARADLIKVALDAQYQDVVTMPDATRYLVWAVHRTTGVLALGKETKASKRSIFTINARLSVRKLA